MTSKRVALSQPLNYRSVPSTISLLHRVSRLFVTSWSKELRCETKERSLWTLDTGGEAFCIGGPLENPGLFYRLLLEMRGALLVPSLSPSSDLIGPPSRRKAALNSQVNLLLIHWSTYIARTKFCHLKEAFTVRGQYLPVLKACQPTSWTEAYVMETGPACKTNLI